MTLATRCKSTEALEVLLRYGGNPNEELGPKTVYVGFDGEWEYGRNLLDIATETGNGAAADVLLKHGAERVMTKRITELSSQY